MGLGVNLEFLQLVKGASTHQKGRQLLQLSYAAAFGQSREIKAEEIPPEVVLEAVGDALLLLALIEEQDALQVNG